MLRNEIQVDRKSRFGICIFMGNLSASVATKSKNAKYMAISSTQAEYMALSERLNWWLGPDNC